MEINQTGDRKKFQKNYLIAFFSILAGLICIIIIISTGGKSTESTSTFSRITHERSGEVLLLEIAKTPQERARGYMFREDIKENQGMLFIFEDEQYREFWMKNTPTSLDIIFLDSDFKVINFHKETKPNQTQETYPSKEPAMYVLETRYGFIERTDLSKGDLFIVE